MQVCNPSRPDIPPHLATAVAGNHHEKSENSDANATAKRRQDNGSAHTSAQLSPLLAFNLGLDHHLAPFLDVSESNTASSSSSTQQSPASLPAPSRTIVVQRKAVSPQEGLSGQRNETIAKALWLAKVRNPMIAIIGDSQHSQEQPSGSASRSGDGQGDQGEPAGDARAILSRSDDTVAELVRALQGHFQEHPRSAFCTRHKHDWQKHRHINHFLTLVNSCVQSHSEN